MESLSEKNFKTVGPPGEGYQEPSYQQLIINSISHPKMCAYLWENYKTRGEIILMVKCVVSRKDEVETDQNVGQRTIILDMTDVEVAKESKEYNDFLNVMGEE